MKGIFKINDRVTKISGKNLGEIVTIKSVNDDIKELGVQNWLGKIERVTYYDVKPAQLLQVIQ